MPPNLTLHGLPPHSDQMYQISQASEGNSLYGKSKTTVTRSPIEVFWKLEIGGFLLNRQAARQP